MIRILQEAGYDGYHNVEYGAGHDDPTPLIVESLDYLRGILA